VRGFIAPIDPTHRQPPTASDPPQPHHLNAYRFSARLHQNWRYCKEWVKLTRRHLRIFSDVVIRIFTVVRLDFIKTSSKPALL
jgi:hypothetical protein